MANATKDLSILRHGSGGRKLNLPMGDTETVFKGTMVSQDASDGGAERINTGVITDQCIGVATHGQVGGVSTGDERIIVETGRIFRFNNAGGGNDCDETLAVGSDVFAEDDNTISDNDQTSSLAKAGTFEGLDEDGKVRVYIEPRT